MLLSLDRRPALFETGDSLWEDEYISKGMLAAHLDHNIDAASRKPAFIDKSVEWINRFLQEKSDILDLGCGPGLYAERLARIGHRVTGVDISKRSLNYATQFASENKLDVRYLLQNYVHLKIDTMFDAALMIYCDFGVLSPEKSTAVLNNVFHVLRPGGLFLFDVFTPKYLERHKERKVWHTQKNGFWQDGEALCLEADYLYEKEKAIVEQYLILSENGVRVFRNWNRVYTTEELIPLLESAGFTVRGIYADVCGNRYNETSETLCVVARRNG